MLLFAARRLSAAPGAPLTAPPRLLEQALKLEPQSAKLYSARANAQLKLEQYLEAAQDAGKAIDLDPSLASAYVRKG